MYSGSIVAIVTPMSATGELDLVAWDALVDWHLAEGSDGIVVGGTTGESPTVTLAEQVELTRRAAARVRGRVPLIAGSGTNDTARSIERTRELAAAGADAVLVVTPYYNKPTQEGLFQHFSAIADDSSVPVILYNVPSRTGVDLLPETAERLAAHPRIVSLKEATGNLARLAELQARCGTELELLSGDDPIAAEAILAGARGVISVTANVVPRAMHELASVALRGDADQARALDARLQGLHRALFVESNPIPVKWAVARLGLTGDGIRLPLTPLSAAGQVTVREAMRAAGVACD
ncbi:MAG TPA: 4-hydroxy-tetrahydrodipicolinate synthase [Steroidobacteraceae bacterium]|nr:4-hydroxy-tetrahydrodipicolinate synthase [Steroidobacteraceae bacterium]